MSRYVAPLGFTLAATWVATIFVLVTRPLSADIRSGGVSNQQT